MSVSFTQFSSSWHCKNLVLEESACCKTKTLCCRNLYCVCCMRDCSELAAGRAVWMVVFWSSGYLKV